MNVKKFIEDQGMQLVPNPNYNPKSKKNKEPKLIKVPQITPETSSAVKMAIMDFNNQYSITAKENEKYSKYGLNYSPLDNMEQQLAYAQSNWAKAFNALGQSVVSEFVLGTIGAFGDIFDFISSKILHITEDDYQNPVSTKVKEWQDTFRNEIAPIYADPTLNIQNGGLKDFGWWMKGMPNIASTLMLLFPAKTLIGGASLLIKGSKFAKQIGNARRWATGIDKMTDVAQMNKFQSAINSFEGVNRANAAVKMTGEALLMRTAENYQESRDTYLNVYKQASDEFAKMDDEEFAEWANNASAIFGDDKVDKTNKDEVAKYIAKKSADRTFAMDWSNAIFDIIQLYGLRNIGRGVKPLERSRKINKMQEESITNARNIKPIKPREGTTPTSTPTATPEEATSFLEKTGAFGKRALKGIYDAGKLNAKIILTESTEGVEEAVNYIAQQEGITYGKLLLAGKTDNYNNSFLVNTFSSWNNLNGNFDDYLKTPELQESAFWGLFGGVAFHYVGSAANKAQLAIDRYQENKKLRENPLTGEKIPKSTISELFESDDLKVARMVMQKREIAINDLESKMKLIEEGKDPYSTPNKETKEYEDFKGDRNTQAEIARARAITEFRSELAIDAINSGTYDYLIDYFKSDEVKQAMVNLGIVNESEVESFTQETIRDLEEAKEEYAKQSAHVLNQVAFINNKANREKRKEIKRRKKKQTSADNDNVIDENILDEDDVDISPEYARIIAKENYINARAVKAINNQLAKLGILESEQRALLQDQGIDIPLDEAKEATNISALVSAYELLSQQEATIESETPTNTLQRLDKFNQLNTIKAQKEGILKRLAKSTFLGQDSGLASVYTAILTGERAKNKILNISTEPSDTKILNDVRAFFGEENKNVSGESIIQSAKANARYLNALLNRKDDNSIVNVNAALFNLFVQSSQLNLQKALLESQMNNTTAQIRDRVNFWHNNFNEVRKTKITFAEAIVQRAIEEYDGVIDENTNKPLIEAINEAYLGNIEEARRIAEEVMANPGEGAVTASEFIDALNILAMHRNSNKAIYDWISGSLNARGEQIRRSRVRESQENSTNSEQESSVNSGQPTNPQQTAPQTAQQGQRGQNQPNPQQPAPQNKPSEFLQLIINNKGNIVSVKSKSSNPNNKYYPVIKNDDGTFEIDTENIDIPKTLDLIATGLFDIDSEVDFQDPGKTWEVTQNPVIKLKNKGGYEVVTRGKIENISSQPLDPSTQPSQPSQPSQPQTPTPAINPTPTPTAQPTPTTSPVEGSKTKSNNFYDTPHNYVPKVGDKLTIAKADETGNIINKKTKQIVEINNNIIKFDDGTQIFNILIDEYNKGYEKGKIYINFITNVEEVIDQEGTTDTTTNIPSTGEGVALSGETTTFEDDVDNEIVKAIPNITADNIDFDAARDKVINAIKAKYPQLDESAIVNHVTNEINNKKAAHDYLKNLSSSLLQSAGNAMYSCKIEDTDSENFSSIFDAAIKKFLEEYEKVVLVKKIDGKQVVKLVDLLKLCKMAYPSSKQEAYGFYNVVKNYLNKNFDKYIVLDINEKPEVVFNNVDKTSEQIAKESEESDDIRINIRDIIESNPTQEYFDELDRLKVGDTVQLVVQDGKLVFISNGITIGTATKPYIAGDKFYQINQGWITDVKLDANGNPISEILDIFKDIFIGNGRNNDELRELITRVISNNEKITDQDALDFQNNILIQHLIATGKQRASNKEHNTIFKFDKNSNIDAKSALLHLVRLWRYTDVSTIAINPEKVKENIATNLEAWFGKIYRNYKTIYGINESQEVHITQKRGGSAIRAIEGPTFERYNELPLSNDAIGDPDNAKLTIVDDEQRIIISGHDFLTIPGYSSNSTMVSLFGANTLPDFVKAYGVRLSDQNAINSNELFKKLGNAVMVSLYDALIKMIDAGYNSNTKEVEDILRSIIATDNNGLRIPLFRAIKGNFTIEPAKNPNDGSTGIKVVYKEKGDNRYYRFFFFNRTRNNGGFGFTNVTNNNIEILKNPQDKNRFAQNAVLNFFSFLTNRAAVNIDLVGIKMDNVSSNNLGGFIRKENGKVIVDIPNSKVPFHEEFDSYSDFLIRNNLLRVNTKKSKNGTNFERFGKNQTLNATISVSLPINNTNVPIGTQTTSTETLPSNVKLDNFTNKEDYVELANKLSDKPVDGETLLLNVLSEEDINKLLSVTDNENLLVNDLLPQNIQYYDDVNDYNRDDINSQPIAQTNSNDSKSTYKYYRNGVEKRKAVGKTNFTIVGPRFVNMASSLNRQKRYNAIKILFHEKIHNILQSPEHKNKRLLQELETVYDEFIRLAKEDINNDNISEKDKDSLRQFINLYDQYKFSHEGLAARGKIGSYRHVEEFLVDSLTNSILYNYLNSKTTEDATDNGKPKNLLTRIINAIVEFFGWNKAKDGTVLMKELNIIREFYDNPNILVKNTETISNENVREKVDDSVDESAIQAEPEQTEESVTPVEPTIPVEPETKRSSIFTEDEINELYGDNVEEVDDSEEEYYDDDDMSLAVIEDVSDTNSIPVSNIDAFKNTLPLSLQAKFAASVNQGLIETRCK